MIKRGVMCACLLALACGGESERTELQTREQPVETPSPAVEEPEDEPDEPAVPAIPTVEPGDPVDDGRLTRAPARITARVRRLREGESAAQSGADMIAPDRYVFGLPAMSEDGTRIAVAQHEGDAFDSSTEVLIFEVPSGRQIQSFVTNVTSVAEDEELDEEEYEAKALRFRRVARDANRYLHSAGFRSMIPIPERREGAPLFRGVPMLVWSGERTDEVIIRDPGNSAARYRALALGQPREEVDPDNDDPDHACDTDTPDVLEAWFVGSPDTVLLHVKYEHAADWCSSEHHWEVLRLPALRRD